MGFPDRILQLIMGCISTVSYQVLINGQPSTSFTPARGIRQDAQCHSIHGIQVARNAPKITHLLFADGSLLFARANQNEANTIIQVLNKYQLASDIWGFQQGKRP
ncbi:hypothetical protein P8452_57930 [Trifolium repens]|nr:hypothetical protein P8452_57930 [Trifolium repens]